VSLGFIREPGLWWETCSARSVAVCPQAAVQFNDGMAESEVPYQFTEAWLLRKTEFPSTSVTVPFYLSNHEDKGMMAKILFR